MAMIKMTVIGNIGADAVQRETNGRKYTTFNVAVSSKYKNQDGTETERTTWISCARDRRRRGGRFNALVCARIIGASINTAPIIAQVTMPRLKGQKITAKIAGTECYFVLYNPIVFKLHSFVEKQKL